ncbi:XRE family transcriptional regulator [Skermanella stibiiresistens SB22]|uniref:XRE family transcriptional regulator n=1 Tax=Skermanella stibiiresistens SB22 TaxID=1385369 RepID=W9H7W5_9PROT|nr:XRE family transcriptional regulator [Skermanella stibiiresistens]EWY40856.1 XRE family transcriptional regulator [Skermanella stibiiresistens SB22]
MTDETTEQGGDAADGLTTGSSAPDAPVRTLEQALGSQIRSMRRQFDLTASELAASAAISKGMLSKIENGQISPSLGTLQSIAAALNVPISALFASFEEKSGCSYVRAGQGVMIERRGTKVGHKYELLGHTLGGKVGVEPYLITLKEDATPYTAFRHAGVEFIHMLSGEIVYRHGDRSFRLSPGDSLLFDSGAAHGPEGLTSLPATYLSIIIFPSDID